MLTNCEAASPKDKDYEKAEREFKIAIAAAQHPASQWITLAGFYFNRERFDDMSSAIHSAVAAANRDRHSGVALYDGASLLSTANRDLAQAATMLQDYLAGFPKTEEAPAFAAHARLAHLKSRLGDSAAAIRERSAALALAHDYKPALDLKVHESGPQEATQGADVKPVLELVRDPRLFCVLPLLAFAIALAPSQSSAQVSPRPAVVDLPNKTRALSSWLKPM